MIYQPKFFKIQELVCEHVYNKWAGKPDFILNFFDPRLLVTLDFIRERLGKPITVNNWKIGGSFSQRGLRCNICDLVASKTKKGQIYMSSHSLGKACDFDVKGMSAKEVRDYIVRHADELPYPISLEDDVTWVHLDMRFLNNKKVYLFKA